MNPRISGHALRAASLGVGALLGCGLIRALQTADTNHPAVSLRLQPGSYQTPVPPSAPNVPNHPVKIEADATRPAPHDLDARRAITDAIATVAGNSGEKASETDSPDWFLWGRLTAQPIALSSSSTDGVRVYAVGSDEGATVCLVNTTVQRTPIHLQTRLPRGVYKVERLTLSSSTPATPASAFGKQTSLASPTKAGARVVQATNVTQELPAPSNTAGATAHLDRLEGSDLAKPTLVTKHLTLEPGQAMLVRFTDVARAAWIALSETRNHLHTLAQTAPGTARRLRRILDEGNGYLGGLTASPGRRSDPRLRQNCVHRLLLLVGQAQSLHRNLLARGTVRPEPGAAIAGSLERLTDALAETSATQLGLVPQIVVEPEQSDAPMLTHAGHDSSVTRVTVSLANTGSKSVALVKLGLDSATLPTGVQCEPNDPAIFDTLRPGQTVRALFRLRSASPMSIPGNRCGGDVSYFAAGCAAHLRPRAW